MVRSGEKLNEARELPLFEHSILTVLVDAKEYVRFPVPAGRNATYSSTKDILVRRCCQGVVCRLTVVVSGKVFVRFEGWTIGKRQAVYYQKQSTGTA